MYWPVNLKKLDSDSEEETKELYLWEFDNYKNDDPNPSWKVCINED